MTDRQTLIEKVEKNGHEIFWQGKATREQVEKLQLLLNVKLPESFKSFLLEFGGGGVIDAEISGIEDNNAEIDNGGTVYGDTLLCREEYDLPEYLVTIFFRDDEVCWCLDTKEFGQTRECPVVSYNLFSKVIEGKIANDFELFFKAYLELRTQ